MSKFTVKFVRKYKSVIYGSVKFYGDGPLNRAATVGGKSFSVLVLQKVETAGEFADEGTETHFAIGRQPAFIRAVSTGNRRSGIKHSLYVEETEVPEYVETE